MFHEVVAHTVPRRAAVAVMSELPRPKPPIVSWLAPLIGPLPPVKIVAAGPSNENAPETVPTARATVSPKFILAPEPAAAVQDTEVVEYHMELRQRVVAIVMVAVGFCTPRFVPSSVRGQPPETGTLKTFDAVITGPS